MKTVQLSTATGWRGGEQQALYLATALAGEGVEVLVVAPPGAPLLERAAAAGLPTQPCAIRCEVNPAAVWRLRRVLRSAGADLVHVHDAHGVIPAGAAAWLAGGVKVVASRRVDFALRGGWKYRRCADRVVCISRAVERVCRDGGAPEHKLRVVRSGVDPERFRGGEYSKAKLREELGIDRKDDVILNVAALTDHKGQRYLLDAMLYVARDHPRVHLLIAGDGELEGALRAQARELALEEKVHFLGRRSDVGALLHLADVFVMASHLEGLCTSVLDAMAMEVAPVVTDAGGLPEIVEDGVTGRVVPAKTPEALADALVAELRDRKARQAHARAARAWVEREATVAQMAAGTLAVYRELLAERGSPTA